MPGEIPQSSGNIPPELDVCEIPSEPLNHPDVDESSGSGTVLNCEIFRPNDTYFHIHHEPNLGEASQVICPDHYTSSKLSVIDCGWLYFSTNGGFPIPNEFTTPGNYESTWFNHPQQEKRKE